ncbi:hypothetical protein H7849_16455 [Alloacidobacterium dinghuense]|uniref:Uncharacterized protein n=1 Tax=Alloacidobacterium dinghuense TaxID=2763107 RepID=A0A7G8BDU2_9BACT|nr:hypothetical protein [Alloacidobacterium dinghuense]QNI30712.1 hypothetical protein H7849_16455 [Alloacidobacterium dinghuense]
MHLRLLLTAPVLMAASGYAQATLQPLPDVPTLMKQVEDHQRKLDQVRENYTYHEVVITHELDKNGNIKKNESEENNVFFVNGHEIDRKFKKDGKELNEDQQKKEQERVEKEVEKASKTPPGQSLDKNEVSVSRLLQIMKVSNARREQMDGRSVIAFDFTGDPHAKTHGIAENASKKLSGTIWIDENDRQVRRMIARFDDNFHLGFGLFSVGKGSTFAFDQKLVNNELWLPTGAQAHVVAHAVGILGWRGDIAVTDNDYEKFHADAVQQAGATVVNPPTH